MKCRSIVHIATIGALAALAGCSGAPQQNLLPESFAGEVAAVTEGHLHGRRPYPLDAIAERPIDLAVLSKDQALSRLAVSGDQTPTGRRDVPWLAHPSEAGSEGDFNPAATPFWAAPAPAWVDVDLGRLCYVSQVIVEPYSTEYGVSEYSVSLIGGDGVDIPVASNVQPAPDAAIPNPSAPSPAIVASFSPRVAQRVKLQFTKTGASQEPTVYIRRIRVLGAPVDGPFTAEPADVAEPLLKALDANRQDLAAFAPDVAAAQISASGEFLAGSAATPWLADRAPAAYWAAWAPAAVTVDLGKPCYVDQVIVWPLSEAYGAGRVYVKAITGDGAEVDTDPPADVAGPEVAPPGTGFRPQPLAAAFEPVAVQKLRVYFPRGGFANNAVYVQRIQIQGIPALE